LTFGVCFFFINSLIPKLQRENLRSIKSVFGNDVILDDTVIKHVLKRHPEIGKLQNIDEKISLAIADPDFVFEGRYGENIAVRKIEETVKDTWIVAPYTENGKVKTTFIVSNIEKIIRRRAMLWKRK